MKTYIFVLIMLSAIINSKAQSGFYFNKDFKIKLYLIYPLYQIQITNVVPFMCLDSNLIDSINKRDAVLRTQSITNNSDNLVCSNEGIVIQGSYSVLDNVLSLKDTRSECVISTFTIVDSLSIKLESTIIKTFSHFVGPLYFYKTISYFQAKPGLDFNILWRYSDFDNNMNDCNRDKNWYFYDSNETVIKIVSDKILVHPLSTNYP